MAYFRTTQAFHLRNDLNFYAQYHDGAGSGLLDNVFATIGGRVYEDYQIINQSDTGVTPAVFYCGAGMTHAVTGISGGPVTAYYAGTYNHSSGEILTYLQFRGFSISADALQHAETAGSFRVEALLSQMLKGNDTILLSNFADTMQGRGGNDTMHGWGGNDTLSGGSGKDLIFGDIGADQISGDDGADHLLGGAGADRLYGGTGMDTLSGGTGSDTLEGGKDVTADLFVFDLNTGTDEITDFEHGMDRIEIVSGAQSFGTLAISQHGAAAWVQFGTATIILDHITATDLTNLDFLFG